MVRGLWSVDPLERLSAGAVETMEMEFVLAWWEKKSRRKERLKEIKTKFFTY